MRAETAARLRSAVMAAGGNKAVAARSGVKLSTLNNYLRQVTGLKLEAAEDIACACGVNLDWLLYGKFPRDRTDPSPAPVEKIVVRVEVTGLEELACATDVASQALRSVSAASSSSNHRALILRAAASMLETLATLQDLNRPVS